MYLSQIRLNLQHPGVRRALRDCNDLHRDLMSAFPQTQTASGARREEAALYRLIERKNEVLILMSSKSVPDAEQLRRHGYDLHPDSIRDISALETVFQAGMHLRFELLASPCKKIRTGGKNSRRVFLSQEQDRLDWMKKQGEKYGFSICNMQENPVRVAVDGCKGDMRIHYDAVRISGVLEIADAKAFWKGYCGGVGPGKSYGLGMLTVSRGM